MCCLLVGGCQRGEPHKLSRYSIVIVMVMLVLVPIAICRSSSRGSIVFHGHVGGYFNA